MLKWGVVKKPAGIKAIIGLKAAQTGFTYLRKSDFSNIAEISRRK
jgi:hypothetical protein